MIKREANAERKCKSRATMSAGKIAEIKKYDRERKHLSQIMKKNENCFKSVPVSKFKILQLKNNTTKNMKNGTVENFVTENLVTEKNWRRKCLPALKKVVWLHDI